MRTRLAAAFASLAVSAVAAPAANAGIDAWTTGDQPGGELGAVALSGSAALAGTTTLGAFRSGDGGASWQRIPALADKRVARGVAGVAIDPAPGGPWYAATNAGMWRSLDAGGTWAEISGAGAGPGQRYDGVAVDAGHPGTVFFIRSFNSGGGVFRSTTQGTGAWIAVGAGLPIGVLDGMLVDPVTQLAWGWVAFDGVYVLGPGSDTWEPASGGLPSTSIRGIALDASGSRRVIVGTTSGLATLPATGGPSWTPINGGLAVGEQYVTALGYDGGGAVYMANLSRRIWRLAGGAATWSQSPASGLPASFAVAFAGDPTQADRLLALTGSADAPNVGLGPAWRSADGGATFTRAAAGIDAVSVRSVAPDPRREGHVLVATRADAIQRSEDRGVSWAPGAAGLPSTEIRSLVADGAEPGVWYAFTSVPKGLHRSTDDGATWTAAGTVAPGDPASSSILVALPGRSGVLYAADEEDSWKSTDGGKTWAKLTPLPASVNAIAPDPAQPGAIWAATDVGVWHLAEGAVVWTESSTGLGDPHVGRLAVDPRSPATLYAGLQTGAVNRSSDAGLSWNATGGGLPAASIGDVVVDPQLADTVYAATASGVYRSSDAGVSWSPLTGGITLPYVTDLAFDADGRTLYAGTEAIGLAARTRPAPAAPASGGAPRLLTAPAVSGTARRGRRLTATTGTWGGEPAPALSVAWQRCTSATACRSISGATRATYTLKTADVGRRIRARVTAVNPSGTATADSALTTTVRSKPVVTQKPLIRGTPRAGRRLRPRGARFAASPSAKLSRRWERCPPRGGTCRAIGGATGASYTTRVADVGRRLRFVVTARNTLGRTVVRSARSAVVGG